MEPKVAAYLANFFTRVRGVDFQNVGILGKYNVEVMARMLTEWAEQFPRSIKEAEKNMQSSFESSDIMRSSEYGAELMVLQSRLGNAKYAASVLKSQKIGPKEPLLPSLRNSDYFQGGDDVLLYVGKGMHGNAEFLREFSGGAWVQAKVMYCSDAHDEQVLHLYCDRSITKHKDFSGRYFPVLATSPMVCSWKEFWRIRVILGTGYEYRSKIFLANCERAADRYDIVPYNDDAAIRKMYDCSNYLGSEACPTIGSKTDKKIILDMVSDADQASYFAQETKKIAIAKGYLKE